MGNLQAPQSSRSGDNVKHMFPRYSAEPEDDKDGIPNIPTEMLRSFMCKQKPSGIFYYFMTCLLLILFYLQMSDSINSSSEEELDKIHATKGMVSVV
jgi:hypothetical protein